MSLCLVNIHGDIEGDYEIIADLPRDATNGEVIKAMFPNIDYEAFYRAYFGYLRVKGSNIRVLEIDDDWWNAPYERRSKA